MATLNIVRQWWHEYRCTPGITSPYGFFGRHPIRAANTDVIEAYRVFEQAHLALGYVPLDGAPTGSKRYCPTGIAGQTCEPSGKNCSGHNYCISLDVEYSRNKYPKGLPRPIQWSMIEDHTVYTPEIVAGLEGIRNIHGEQLFKWLGLLIGDTMHWDINVPPERMGIDYSTVPTGVAPPVPPPTIDDEVYVMQTLRKGDGLVSREFGDRTFLAPQVAAFQASARSKGYEDGNSNDAVCGIDGAFWTGTEAVAKAVQAGANITVDGIVGVDTWAAVMS